ncbi:CC0125/CC1285 family lipoprotein [Chitinimonas sp.]|uniref:CC0125/CC1285 family lipoprotein n=1 Tax=Chitinimonas sp. TaxID=1934313 RepID=UPI002F92F6F0
MKFLNIGLLLISLTGCSTAYQANSLTGGFSETQLDTNLFKVTFQGNGFTKPEAVEEMALLRSAELTLKHGFTHFVVVNTQSRNNVAAVTTPTQSYTTANATAFGNTAYGSSQTTTYGGQTFLIATPSASNTILCFKGKPDTQALAYDASFICSSLGQKYGASCGQK